MASNGALDLSIRIMGKVDPSLAKSISQVKGMTGSLLSGMQGVNSLAYTVTNTMGAIGKTGLAAGAALTGAVVVGIKQVTNEAAKLEAQMAPVMRYVDGLADSSGKASDAVAANGKTFAQNYSDMENYIQNLSTEIPRTTEQLTTMSAALGQSGKDVDEQLGSGILRDTAVAATAMDLDDQTAGDYMAKWEVAFSKRDEEGNRVNYSHDDVMRLMNQINYLGANNATTAAEIALSVNKSASIGQLAGVDPSTTAAIATAMQATGVDTARTGTAISRIYTNVSKGSSATKAQKEMWEELGFTSTGVAKSMQEDGTKTLMQIFGAINKLPDERKVAALNTLFGQWVIEGGAKITNNLDLLTKTLSEVSDPAAYSNSMEREFAINSGTQESLGIMRDNARTVLMQDAGEAFLPAQKELTRLQLDLYKGIDESLPDLSGLVNSALPLLRTAIQGIGDAAKTALPWIQKGIDYTTEHGPEVAGAIAAIVAAFGAMSLAPTAYSVGSTLLNTVGNIAIGGRPSGAPGGTFGGITVRNLLGALSPTSVIQNTVGGMKSGASNLWNAGKAAVFGAGLANSSMTNTKGGFNVVNGNVTPTDDSLNTFSGIRGMWAKAQNGIIGAAIGFKNRKSLTRDTGKKGSFWKSVLGTANEITEAKQSGGLLGMLKDTAVGRYATSVGDAVSGFATNGKSVLSSLGRTGFIQDTLEVGKWAGAKAGSFLSGAGTKIGTMLSGIGAGAPAIMQPMLNSPLASALGGIGSRVKGFAGNVAGAAGTAWLGAKDLAGRAVQSKTGQAIIGGTKNAVQFVGTAAKGAGTMIGSGLNVAGAVLSPVGAVAGKLGSGFMSLLGTFGPVITGIGTMVAAVSLLGDHFEDIRGIVKTVFGEGGLAVFDNFTGKIKGIGDTAKQVFGQLSSPEGLQNIQQQLSGVNFMGFNLGDVFGAAMPAIQTVMPLIQSFAGVFSQIVDLGVNHIKPLLVEIFGFVVNEGIPAVMPLLSTVVSLVGTILVNAIKTVVDVVGKLLPVVEPVILGIIGFLKQVATVGVKVVNFIIRALNKIQLTIPETLFGIPIPLVGGKSFGFNLSEVSLPAFANGGMTQGPSIAGEAGPEAVISFKRGVREKNIDTWLTAGGMLGVGLGDLLGLPGRKPKLFADGGFTEDDPKLIDFRKAQRQQQFNQIAQSFKAVAQPVAAGLMLGSDAGVAFSRITEIANYAADGLEALAAMPVPEVSEDQGKVAQFINTGIGKAVTGAQSILANDNAQKVIQFIREADVEKAQLEYEANPDNYDLSNVSFFPTVNQTDLAQQGFTALQNLQNFTQQTPEVEIPSIGGTETPGGNTGTTVSTGSGSGYQRTYTSTSGNTYVYAPNFTIYGSMDADDLRALLDEGYEKFCEYMERYEWEKRRTQYA